MKASSLFLEEPLIFNYGDMKMPRTIEQWRIDTYHDNIFHALQQEKSLLENTVMPGSMKGKKKRFSFIGATEMDESSDRNADTTYSDNEFYSRWVSARYFDKAFLVDDKDVLEVLTDPTSHIVQAIQKAGKRTKDQVIIDALNATAYAGENAEIIIPFPDKQVMDIQLGGSNNQPLNLDKIMEAKYWLDDSDVDPDEERFMLTTPFQIKNLLNITEIKSSDYNVVKALQAGKIDTYHGFKFIVSNKPAFDKANNIRTNFAWSKSAMVMAMSKEISTDALKNPTKKHNWSLMTKLYCNAVRLYDEAVIEIPCHETPRANA